MSSKFIISTKLIYLIFILFNNFAIFSSLSFSFPNAVTLIDGNYFVIHKYGISICDSSFSKIISNITISENTELISNENDLYKIEIKMFQDGYILSVIFDKIYIFDYNGNKKYTSNSLIPQDVKHLTLVPYKIDINNYYYLLGYIYQRALYLYFYKFDSLQNKVIAKIEVFYDRVYYSSYKYDQYYINDNGISCQFLYYNKNTDLITCCYQTLINNKKYLTISTFSINTTGKVINFESNKRYGWNGIESIKSSSISDHSKALFCLSTISGLANCFIYKLNDYNDNLQYYYYETKCSSKTYGFKVEYYKEKEEFAFSCLTQNGGIEVGFYDKSLTDAKDEIYKFIDCESIYGYSLLYNQKNNSYFVISDVKCNNIEYPFEELIVEVDDKKEKLEGEKIQVDNDNEKEKDLNILEKEEKYEEEKEEYKEEKEDYKEEKEEYKEEKEEFKEEKQEYKEEKEEYKEEKEEYKEEKEECQKLDKCETCDEESISKNLCIKCNNKKGYYYLNNKDYNSKKTEISKYIDCVNNDTKPSNFYFNKEEKDFRICYETCATCDYGGNGNEHNYTSCEVNYIIMPDIPNSTHCVFDCLYFYYYTSYNQYKCTEAPTCPKDFNLLVEEKRKCTDNCLKDNLFKYQYNGFCLKNCPNGTVNEIDEYLCKDQNLDKCVLSENEFIFLNDNITDKEIETIAKNYANEFQYTENHVSRYKNIKYSITLYKNTNCISELSLKLPEIDFGNCYEKLKKNYQINGDLIIAIVKKYTNEIMFYSFYEPYTGEKLASDEICKGETIIFKEDILSKLDQNNDIDSILYLAKQNINIFNLSNEFFNDICYQFESPTNKDITLKDRILYYYPNVSLCDDGCYIQDINLTSFKAICECKYNGKNKNMLFGNNLLVQSQIGEIESLITETNIEILKCYRLLINYKFYLSFIGGYIIIIFLLIQIILTFIYHNKSLHNLKKYIFNTTNNFTIYLIKQKVNELYNYNNSLELYDNLSMKKNQPPKRQMKINKIERKNIIRKTKKYQTKKEKNQINRNKGKKRLTYYQNPNIKNLILNNNNYQINISNENIQKKNKISLNNNDTINIISENNYKSNINVSSFKEALKKNKLFINNNDYLIKNSKDINFNAEEYLSTEIDQMDFDDAIKKDKRKFFEFLLENLKINQISLNTFNSKEPLKPRSIKIMLYILDLDLYLFINGLFFDEEYISEIFKIEEEDNFFTFIPRSIDRLFYSTVVGVIVGFFIDFFFIDEKKIKGIFKRERNNLMILKFEISKVIKNIKIRFTLFISLSFFILLFTLYYTICFINVYPHLMNEWIKSSFILFIIMQILSILICLFVSIIRFISFRCKSEKLYKISLYLS